MKYKLVLFIACMIGASFGQTTPFPPQWPFGFSATILFTNGTQPPQLLRWFYDYVLQMQRIDQVVTVGTTSIFVNVYFDFSNKIQYNVEYIENTVSCQVQELDESLGLPSFNDYQFLGPNLVGYTQTYAWNKKAANSVFRVWDRIEDRVIIRWEELHSDKPKLTYDLWEMDPNPQDPSLFLLPETIAVMCEQTKISK